MSTKEKILAKALGLFNENGVETVTTRQIALALGMSQGNLCYHYPKKKDIIKALYEQLVQQFDELYEQLAILSDSKNVAKELMSGFQKMILLTNQYFVDFKFLMLNFVQIMRWYPEISAHYQQLTVQRNQQTLGLFQLHEQVGLLQKEAYEGQYSQISEQFMILNNFWLSHAEILYEGKEINKLKHFNQLVCAYIYPHLTDYGKKVYKEVIGSYYNSNHITCLTTVKKKGF